MSDNKVVPTHEFDDDGCCVHCNFDGAEWHWWKHSTYEGRASDATIPLCTTERFANQCRVTVRNPEGDRGPR